MRKITAKQRDLKINVQRLPVREMNGKYVMSCPPAQGGCDFISLRLLKSRDLSYALYVPRASGL